MKLIIEINSNFILIFQINSKNISQSSKTILNYFLKAYIILHKSNIICLSRTHLDSATPTDDDKSKISGYTLIHSDNPSNAKRGGVFTVLSYKYWLFSGISELSTANWR